MPRELPHLFVDAQGDPHPYRPHGRRIDRRRPPAPPNARAHASNLHKALVSAAAQGILAREQIGISVPDAKPGLYVTFESHRRFPLKLDSLEHRNSGIEVVAVTTHNDVERAVVFLPEGKVKYFLRKIEAYAGTDRTPKGERKNKDLVEGITRIRRATLRALWTDDPDAWPHDGEAIWWEVWLRDAQGAEERRFHAFAAAAGISLGERRLTFPERVVVVARGTVDTMSSSIEVLGDIAEVRRAKDIDTGFLRMEREEQSEFVRDLLDRLQAAPANAPAICVLDTGVNNGHPLLVASLADADRHAWDPSWGTDDHEGHGTEMAGLALFGDLMESIVARGPVRLRHRLESVKIVPPQGENPPELYGAITAESVARVEVQASNRSRAFSLAIAATDQRDRGQPTSWSAAIDAIAAGRSFDQTTQGLHYLEDDEGPRRLFIICAGNVQTMDINHLARSDVEAIHDPGHAWNALTVGASTERATLPDDPSFRGLHPVAQPGDLSPYSSTSVPFATGWPIKPDVVFEGGNRAHDGTNTFQCDELSLLTTHFKPLERPLVSTWATSASTAQVARFAGALAAEYADVWPETIRALIVHSAEWTPRMLSHVRRNGRKHLESALLRRFGFGIPNLDRAMFSARDALTLVAQDRLRPFEDGKLREMRMHDLPWPTETLRDLGDEDVRMRVTLSYFVEPNPGRRGWRKRHSYASHGLRFDVRGATESSAEFLRRLNALAIAEDEERPTRGGDSSDWRLGPILRHRGSLHSDIWTGSAADLAERGCIGVYPVSGWWKEQPKWDRSDLGVRYALIVSIQTTRTDVDIYSPVAQTIGVAVRT